MKITKIIQKIFGNNPEVNLTVRFALIMLMAAFNGFNVRVDNWRLLNNIGRNPMFIVIALCIIIGTVAMVTFGGDMLQVVPLSYKQWFVVFGLGFLIIPMDMLRKLFNK